VVGGVGVASFSEFVSLLSRSLLIGLLHTSPPFTFLCVCSFYFYFLIFQC